MLKLIFHRDHLFHGDMFHTRSRGSRDDSINHIDSLVFCGTKATFIKKQLIHELMLLDREDVVLFFAPPKEVLENSNLWDYIRLRREVDYVVYLLYVAEDSSND